MKYLSVLLILLGLFTISLTYFVSKGDSFDDIVGYDDWLYTWRGNYTELTFLTAGYECGARSGTGGKYKCLEGEHSLVPAKVVYLIHMYVEACYVVRAVILVAGFWRRYRQI